MLFLLLDIRHFDSYLSLNLRYVVEELMRRWKSRISGRPERYKISFVRPSGWLGVGHVRKRKFFETAPVMLRNYKLGK